MREGIRDNRRAPLLNPDKEVLEVPTKSIARDGYEVLSKARRGEPREEMSRPLRWDEGPWHSLIYPDN